MKWIKSIVAFAGAFLIVVGVRKNWPEENYVWLVYDFIVGGVAIYIGIDDLEEILFSPPVIKNK